MHDETASIIIIAFLPFSVVAVALGLVCTVCFTPDCFFCLLLIFIWQTYKYILNVHIWSQTSFCGKYVSAPTQRKTIWRTSELGRLLWDTASDFLYRTTNSYLEYAVDKSGRNIQAVCLWWESEIQIWKGKRGSIIAWCTWELNTRSLSTPDLSDNWRAN